MSNTDSFIDEVNEEVRRDRLFQLLRRYGWIAVLAIILIVGGAAWSEYRKAQERAKAEALGDAMLEAIAQDAGSAEALANLEAEGAGATALLDLMTAAQHVEDGENGAALETLNALAVAAEVPDIYRQLALFKSLSLQGNTMPIEDRRQALEVMAQPGQPLRLLALEQLALIEVEIGQTETAIAQYQAILSDGEMVQAVQRGLLEGLQQRARQVIVALGGEPEVGEAGFGTGNE